MWSKVDIVWFIPTLVSLSWINREVDCCMHSSGVISLDNNGYIGILIGIDEGVAENQELIEKIKEVFTAGSADLYTATRNRSYFKNITISVPKNWSDSPSYDPLTSERYDKSNIIIAEGREGLGNTPYVAGIPECGVSGRYMHLTPQYIMDPSVQRLYGTAGKLVVHEWGHLRYGVYDEYPRRSRDPIYYTSSSGTVEATRCSLAIQGEWSPECQVQNGEPTTGEEDGCRFFDSWQTGGYSASIMYKQFLPYMMHFCDSENNSDSSGMVHNYEAPTKQNVQCNYKSVWEAVVNYINNDVQDGEYLGMVVFSSTAAVKSPLVEMNDTQRASMLPLSQVLETLAV
ncbi:calcium-activated chloride channel regulator family member 3-like [Ptychodera flava]|uniref:calcium-activated chloride channel regulator family member 3-like n=1 Tax=Ptychodera flava TaxID=63121 RepID=UPI00396A918C